MRRQDARFALLRGARMAARVCSFVALFAGCTDRTSPPVLTADMPLHLEDHLEAAVVDGSELPENPPQRPIGAPRLRKERSSPIGATSR